MWTEARMPKGRRQKACGISASSPQQGLRSTGGGPERVDIGGLHGLSCSETWPVKKGVSPLALLAVPSLLWHSHWLRLPVTLHCCSDPVLSRGLALLWGFGPRCTFFFSGLASGEMLREIQRAPLLWDIYLNYLNDHNKIILGTTGEREPDL